MSAEAPIQKSENKLVKVQASQELMRLFLTPDGVFLLLKISLLVSMLMDDPNIRPDAKASANRLLVYCGLPPIEILPKYELKDELPEAPDDYSI